MRGGEYFSIFKHVRQSRQYFLQGYVWLQISCFSIGILRCSLRFPTAARRTPRLILIPPASIWQPLRGAGEQHHSRQFFTQPRGSLAAALGLSLTSHRWLKTVYSLWTLPYPAMPPWTDLGFPLLIGGLARPTGALLRAFARNQQYVFLPLPASFSECVRARRFRPRCSHTVLCIHVPSTGG